ncbi:MAG: Crp/Fnr family transcriptional regulator [Chloroflexi bacterium]|nr:Crp/Fnr family transcriptional regulator [Chloroflexota bacterium]
MSHQISAAELSGIPALRDLTAQDIDCLTQVMVKQFYQAGQLIFLEGERARGIWFVVSGLVRIVKQSSTGRIQTLCALNRGRCFGTCPLFSSEINPATAEALEPTTLAVLPQTAFKEVSRQRPALALILLSVYGQRLAQLAHLSEALGTWSTADRINNCLLTYADYGAANPVVRLTHEELARLSGTVREVVTRHLAQLEKSAIVQAQPRLIEILNLGVLQSTWLCKAATP